MPPATRALPALALVVLSLWLFLISGCTASRAAWPGAVTPPDDKLDPLPAPKTINVPVLLPTVTLTQGDSTQKRGAVSLTLEAELYKTKRQVKEEREELEKPVRQGGIVYTVYRVQEVPCYVADPPDATFKVRIISHHDRILRLGDSGVSFIVGGKAVAVPHDNYEGLLKAIVLPQQEQSVPIAGPPVDKLPDNAVIGVSLIDVVTKMDEAGVAKEKSGFDWYFTYTAEKTTREDKTGWRYDKVPWRNQTCLACVGVGGTICLACGGLGSINHGYWTTKCDACGGTARTKCSRCNGEGKVWEPPAK